MDIGGKSCARRRPLDRERQITGAAEFNAAAPNGAALAAGVVLLQILQVAMKISIRPRDRSIPALRAAAKPGRRSVTIVIGIVDVAAIWISRRAVSSVEALSTTTSSLVMEAWDRQAASIDLMQAPSAPARLRVQTMKLAIGSRPFKAERSVTIRLKRARRFSGHCAAILDNTLM
jgi:hypothetical protein